MKEANTLSQDEKAILQVIQDLTHCESINDVERLDRFYSDNTQLIQVARDGSTRTFDKNQILQFFMDRRAANKKTETRETEFHHIEIGDGTARVVATQALRGFGLAERSLCSFSLTKAEHNWKVVKETVVARN